MLLEQVLQSADYLGTLAFALSGALKAARRGMDAFGMFVLALITAVGGGTLRDLLLGRTPVFWLNDLTYVSLAVAATLVVLILRLPAPGRGEPGLLFFDAVGLGTFTIIGTSAGMDAGLAAPAAVGLGCLTGIGGGIMRDVLALSRPVVLHREIYALASLGGGALLVGLDWLGLPRPANILACAVVVIAVRLLSLRYGWALPRVRTRGPASPKGDA